jgi:hypothetical protein
MKKTSRSAAFVLVLLVVPICLGGNETPRAHPQAQLVALAPTFASLFLKALPTLKTVVSKIFTQTKTTPSSKQKPAIDALQKTTDPALSELKVYAQKELAISVIASSIGPAMVSLAKMVQISGGETPLTGDQVKHMADNLWPDVTEALDTIAHGNPLKDPSIFAGDTNAMGAIKDIVSADAAMKTKITKELTYDPKKDGK